MTSDALRAWRLSYTDEELQWRSADWRSEQSEWRAEREQQRRERRRRDRRYFGVGLNSQNLSRRALNEKKLTAQNLPILKNEKALAEWLNVELSRLRWYTYNQTTSSVYHYVRYVLPKRSGGQRVILAPKTGLKAIQRKILAEILNKIVLTEPAHGFRKGRNIVTNASPHAGKPFVLNLDLKEFFPSITFRRVRGLFTGLGYGYTIASVLALLCTESDREMIQRPDRPYYAGLSPRALVQGAPTSPALANLAARRLDKRLAGLAVKRGVTYTRYADDLTFSGEDRDVLFKLMKTAGHIIAAEGFTVHPKKTRFYQRGQRQIVTGLVVNDKVNTPRQMRRQVRAILHNAAQTGLNAQNRMNHPNFRGYVLGLIAHIGQTAPDLAATFRGQLVALSDS
ncbi:MAG TPA: reverse transcriptase family protein [Aggregatilineales bacterium]|nr:RNA-directed DNA polymerase [Anaerolineales bacterium]HRE46975.1 reverse transcriptase family protein [Aggregatilineales bacterium]